MMFSIYTETPGQAAVEMEEALYGLGFNMNLVAH